MLCILIICSFFFFFFSDGSLLSVTPMPSFFAAYFGVLDYTWLLLYRKLETNTGEYFNTYKCLRHLQLLFIPFFSSKFVLWLKHTTGPVWVGLGDEYKIFGLRISVTLMREHSCHFLWITNEYLSQSREHSMNIDHICRSKFSNSFKSLQHSSILVSLLNTGSFWGSTKNSSVNLSFDTTERHFRLVFIDKNAWPLVSERG